MATLTMSPLRQPFANLESPRLQTLMRSKLNVLNQQNGLATPYKTQPTPEIDTENIDPISLKSSSKRKRSDEDESITKPTKSTRTALPTTFTTPTPRHISLNVIPSTPKSAPANPPTRKPAGRSPPAKSTKSSRRSNIAKRRVEPSNGNGVRRPFSLATALSNGKSKPQSQSQPKPKHSTKQPASWFFDIHEDSEQDEMTNLMQHSTCVLDISDDEGKPSSDGRGKENIPPVELGISLPNSTSSSRQQRTSRKASAVNMDEDRVPLVELNAADYYGDCCHAFSYAVVYDDVCENENTVKESKAESQTSSSLPLPKSHSHVRRGSSLQNVESISAILEATAPVKSDSAEKQTEEIKSDSNLDFEIWESGSASGEAVAVENAEPSAESASTEN